MNLAELIPNYENVEDGLKTHLSSAWKNVFKHNIASAMAFAQQAAKLAPKSPEVAHLLGLLASRDGRSDIALPLLQNALNGGVTLRRLRDMAEALLMANQPLAALAPLNDAMRHFGESSETLGLLSAVQVALEDFPNAKKNAARAIQLKPNLLAWDSNLGFCELMEGNVDAGLKALTGRSENLAAESRVPTLQFTAPCEIWLKNEQGPGDTIFNLRYAKALVEKGFKLHIQTDKKTKTLLRETSLFASVKEEFNCPHNQLWFNVGDLPLAAIQLVGEQIVPPLTLRPDAERVEKMRKKLAAFGSAPYFAVTWRAGPRGKKQRAGLRMFSKNLPLDELGKALSAFKGTVISVQRVPEPDENIAFQQALGREFLNLSTFNDNLQDMLALLSVVDCYIAVPNTNLHLREALGMPTDVFVNRPFQDWRWQAVGEISPWYPNSYIYRQEKNSEWRQSFHLLNQRLLQQYEVGENPKIIAKNPEATEIVTENNASEYAVLNAELKAGWAATDENNISEAIRIAQAVLKIKPDFAPALNLLGWAAYRDQKIEIALTVLQQAVNLDSESGKIVGDFIRVLTANKQHQAALSLAEQALSNPNLKGRAAVLYARAATYVQLNQLENAIADYNACAEIAPNNLEAACYNGMARLKNGDARNGFRLYSARPEARLESRRDCHVCPWLRGNVAGLKVLIKRDMGLGDELTFLRYLPWLTQAGVAVDYWCGHKLLPVLERTGLFNRVISDQVPLPDTENYDLTFWVHELPVAVEALGSPEIAPPFLLTPRADLVEKWRAWLAQCGPAPYIGLNWRAGAAATGTEKAFSKLAKAVDAESFAKTFSGIHATFISLQRNVMLQDVTLFEQHLQATLHDAASLTDDIEDLLALLSLLDENIGVSNTNMHLRAGLGLGSRVLVQTPGGDWRWGAAGEKSAWFEKSKVYRQSLDQSWQATLDDLRQDLSAQYGLQTIEKKPETKSATSTDAISKKIIWLTAGNIEKNGDLVTSNLASARYRVIIPSRHLENLGWHSQIVNEGLSKTMGGWGNATPKTGDILVVSKVFTDHALTLINDAKARGAKVVVDHCDNFFWSKARGALQKKLCELADLNTVSTQLLGQFMLEQTGKTALEITDPTEHASQPASFNPEAKLKVLWFGHEINFRSLAGFFDEIRHGCDFEIELTLVTNLSEKNMQCWEQLDISGLHKRYVLWRPDVMQAEFARCDVVILPIKEDEYGSVKSPNRLTESIQGGKFVVAHPLPSYMQFSDYVHIGKSIMQGLTWARQHPQAVLDKIKEGQQFISAHCAGDAIAQRWHAVFSQLDDKDTPCIKVTPITSEHDLRNGIFQYLQTLEAHRVLAETNADDSLALKRYAQKYPKKYAPKLHRVAVYTAIFGGYDTAPVLNYIDPKLNYILFTDSAAFQAPAPWQVRVVPSAFEDPQVDARRVKVLAHQFLPEHDATVWIDGNFKLEKLDLALVEDILSRAPVALCKHQFRDCIYDEAVEILRRGIDASTPVVKQVQYFQARQFPAKFGLHATSFLVRNHLDSDTIKMNMRWWEILSANSKRDQLSFDFVRWEQSIDILPLPFNLRENALYRWGKQGVGKHEGTARRNDEHSGRKLNYQHVNVAASNTQAYDALHDSWPNTFLTALKHLNILLSQQFGERTNAESILYFDQQPFVHALPDPRKGAEIQACIAQITNARSVLHLGFDMGYLTLLTLHFSGAKNVIAREFLPNTMLPITTWLSEKFPKHVGVYPDLNIDAELLAHFDTVVIYQSENFKNDLMKHLLAHVKQTTTVLMIGFAADLRDQIDVKLSPANMHYFQ